MLQHGYPSIYTLNDIIPSIRNVTTSTSDSALYCSKQPVSLLTAHNCYYLRPLTLSTWHIYAPIARKDADSPASRLGACKPLLRTTMLTFQSITSTWLSSQTGLLPSVNLGFSHSKRAARDHDYYFPTFIATPTTHVKGTALASIRR